MWFQAAAQTTDTCVTFAGHMTHGHFPRHQPNHPQVASGSLIHTWLSVAAQAMDISVASGSCVYHLLQHGPWPATWPLGINVASGDGTDQRHPKGPGWNHRPLTSSCPPLKAVKHEDITKASVSSKDHICPPGSQASSRRGAVAWITGTGMASRGNKDHIGTSRSPVPESKPFLMSGSVVTQSPGCMFGCRVCICASSRLLYTTLPTLLGIDNMSTWALSHTCHSCRVFCSTSLSSTHTGLCFYLSYLSISYVFIIMVPATMTWGGLAGFCCLCQNGSRCSEIGEGWEGRKNEERLIDQQKL